MKQQFAGPRGFEEEAATREIEMQAVADDILNTLTAVPVSDYGAVLGLVVAGLLECKRDAEDALEERAAIRRETEG